MMRDRWRDIRALIEQDIQDGVLEAGAKLPTEPELARKYGAGRHSVRRAIAEIAKAGHLSVEQGRGTFVQPRPKITYTIGRRTRLRQNLMDQGIDVSGEALGSEEMPATARVAQQLNIEEGAPIIVTRRMALADGIPLSYGSLHHDATRFPDFPERRKVLGSVSAVYAAYGITDYVRASTEVLARPARAEEAQRLKQHADMPVMVVRALDADPNGHPIAYSEVIWSAARVRFNINLDELTE